MYWLLSHYCVPPHLMSPSLMSSQLPSRLISGSHLLITASLQIAILYLVMFDVWMDEITAMLLHRLQHLPIRVISAHPYLYLESNQLSFCSYAQQHKWGWKLYKWILPCIVRIICCIKCIFLLQLISSLFWCNLHLQPGTEPGSSQQFDPRPLTWSKNGHIVT